MHPSYFAHCKTAYNAQTQPAGIVIFLIGKSGYVGTLVRTHLAVHKEYTEFFTDEKIIAAHLPKLIGKESVQQIFASLSQDFYVENFNHIDAFNCPVMIFSESISTVVDLEKTEPILTL